MRRRCLSLALNQLHGSPNGCQAESQSALACLRTFSSLTDPVSEPILLPSRQWAFSSDHKLQCACHSNHCGLSGGAWRQQGWSGPKPGSLLQQAAPMGRGLSTTHNGEEDTEGQAALERQRVREAIGVLQVIMPAATLPQRRRTQASAAGCAIPGPAQQQAGRVRTSGACPAAGRLDRLLRHSRALIHGQDEMAKQLGQANIVGLDAERRCCLIAETPWASPLVRQHLRHLITFVPVAPVADLVTAWPGLPTHL